jgi:hypothetical protein
MSQRVAPTSTSSELEISSCDCVSSHMADFLKNNSIILVHGLGGHPVKTWLHTPASEISRAVKKEYSSPRGLESAANLGSSGNGQPVLRALSLRNLASPNQKKGNTLKKPRHNDEQPAAPRLLRVFGSPLRPRSDDFSDGLHVRFHQSSDNNLASTRSVRGAAAAVAAPRTIGGASRSRRHLRGGGGSGFDPRLESPLREGEESTSRSSGAVPPPAERWVAHADDRDADEACDLGTFWPTDLLPDLCCDARTLTWGFRTRISDGHLVPGQFDIFSRGRDLLNDVNDLLTSYREHGQTRREVVFIAHSTGGIIVKEVGRGANTHSLVGDIDGWMYLHGSCSTLADTHSHTRGRCSV